jgi:uridine kinase
MGSTRGTNAGAGEASPGQVASPLIARLRRELTAPAAGPLVVGLDGRSGSGKSTVAAAVADALERGDDGADSVLVTVIEGDSFYGGGCAASWDRRTPAENAALVIDRHRQQTVLEDLRRQGTATWHPFDWDSERWDQEPSPLAARPITAVAAPVVLLEGAYSCRPDLAHLLDLRVLLDVAPDLRRRRLVEREGDDHRPDWDARWSAAEDHYFGTIMPPDRFDLVLAPDR